MLARKCDLCGAFYDEIEDDLQRVNGIAWINIDNKGEITTCDAYDLCPDCMTTISYFITNRKRGAENDLKEIERSHEDAEHS